MPKRCSPAFGRPRCTRQPWQWQNQPSTCASKHGRVKPIALPISLSHHGYFHFSRAVCGLPSPTNHRSKWVLVTTLSLSPMAVRSLSQWTRPSKIAWATGRKPFTKVVGMLKSLAMQILQNFRGRNALRPHLVNIIIGGMYCSRQRHLHYIQRWCRGGREWKAKYVLATFFTDVQQLSKWWQNHPTSLWNPHLQAARISLKRQTNHKSKSSL